MWFTELAGNRIGRYQLTGDEGLGDNADGSKESSKPSGSYCNAGGNYPPTTPSDQGKEWTDADGDYSG